MDNSSAVGVGDRVAHVDEMPQELAKAEAGKIFF